MARLGVLAADNATVRRFEQVLAGFRHKCVARATLAQRDAIAELLERWLVDASIDAILAVGTDATQAVIAPHITEPFAGVPGAGGGRCGKKLVVLVPEAEEAARAPLAAVMPRIDSILGLQAPKLSARQAAAPTNKTIPLDDIDLVPRFGATPTNLTMPLDDADVEAMPAATPTNRTIQLGDDDVVVQPAAKPTSVTIQLGDFEVDSAPPPKRAVTWRQLVVISSAIAIVTAVALALLR